MYTWIFVLLLGALAAFNYLIGYHKALCNLGTLSAVVINLLGNMGLFAALAILRDKDKLS